MISQPVANKNKEEIDIAYGKGSKALKALGYRVVSTTFDDGWFSDKSMRERGVTITSLCVLAESLKFMSHCSAVYFCKGWENEKRCKMEHEAAIRYGLRVIYEKEQ